MTITLGSINAFLRKLKLILVIESWDGRGEKLPTKLKLLTLRGFNKEYVFSMMQKNI
jgi:hypothetical protein